MNTLSATSGFVTEKLLLTEGNAGFEALQELYSSTDGYNVLYRGRRYGRLHVLKALKPIYVGSEFYEQALRKEFNIGYQLEHPFICRTLGWEQLPSLGHCLVMEYVDGITLKEVMEQRKLTPALARKVIKELCEALTYLHSKQIIHRDLKPANILITHNGQNVKLIDFSLSDRDDYEVLKMPAGTRYYLAPEALLPHTVLDCRADIYSLGVVVGEMAALLKDARLAALSRRCTPQRREKRLPSAAAVANALNRPPIPWKLLCAGMVLFLSGFVFFQYGKSGKTESPLPPDSGLATYGNVAVGEACLHLLREAEQRKDTIHLLSNLKKELEKEFPLPAQRHTVAYRTLWNTLQQQAAAIVP